MRLKRSYTDFIAIVTSKGLEIVLGDTRSDSYHLIAIDGQIIYETFVSKDGGVNQVDFESNFLSGLTEKVSEQPDWDDFITTFPTVTSELHTYKKSSITVLEVLITYSDSSRTQITRIQKTRV